MSKFTSKYVLLEVLVLFAYAVTAIIAVGAVSFLLWLMREKIGVSSLYIVAGAAFSLFLVFLFPMGAAFWDAGKSFLLVIAAGIGGAVALGRGLEEWEGRRKRQTADLIPDTAEINTLLVSAAAKEGDGTAEPEAAKEEAVLMAEEGISAETIEIAEERPEASAEEAEGIEEAEERERGQMREGIADTEREGEEGEEAAAAEEGEAKEKEAEECEAEAKEAETEEAEVKEAETEEAEVKEAETGAAETVEEESLRIAIGGEGTEEALAACDMETAAGEFADLTPDEETVDEFVWKKAEGEVAAEAEEKAGGGSIETDAKRQEQLMYYINRGFDAKERGQWEEAIQYFEQAQELGSNPDLLVFIALEIGCLYRDCGRYPEALQVLQEFISQQGDKLSEPSKREIIREIKYIEILYGLLQQVGTPDLPGEKVPRLVRIKAKELHQQLFGGQDAEGRL